PPPGRLLPVGDASSATVGGTDVTSTVGSLNVQFGYFVADRFVIGVDLASITQTMEVGTIEAESSAGQLGLFAAYYFRFGGRHASYPELRLFGGSQEDTDSNGNTDQYDLSGAALGIGYAYAI